MTLMKHALHPQDTQVFDQVSFKTPNLSQVIEKRRRNWKTYTAKYVELYFSAQLRGKMLMP